MHGRILHPMDTQRRDGQAWWCLPWRLAAVIALGLTLANSSAVQAKTFHCGAGDVQCLIDAINAANANGQKNTIRLEAGTYTLTTPDNPDNGLPVITSPLTITGQGSETTVIERDASAPAFRILAIAATGTLTLTKLTLRGGRAGQGAGIHNAGRLTLNNCILSANGGAVGGGGGIVNTSEGLVTITKTTIVGNSARCCGGGLLNIGTVTIAHTAFVGNLGDNGGAFYNVGTMSLINTTVAQNGALDQGAISNDGILLLQNTTVAENLAILQPAGGISNRGTVLLQNTILARNDLRIIDVPSDCAGQITSLGNNLIGDPTGLLPFSSVMLCTITLHPSDLTGDPGLAAFMDNGTPGNGHFPLLPTSQAMDAGSDAVCPRTDQLGKRRRGPCDIGAIEFRDKDDRHHEEEDQHDEEDDHHDRDSVTAAH